MIIRDNFIIKQILLNKQNNRTFTLKSLKTGKFISFRVNRGKVSDIRKQSSGNFEYQIGKIHNNNFIFTSQLELNFNLYPSFNLERQTAIKAFDYLFNNIVKKSNNNVHNKINFMLDNKCRKCHKTLTNSISLVRGYGEKCNFFKH